MNQLPWLLVHGAWVWPVALGVLGAIVPLLAWAHARSRWIASPVTCLFVNALAGVIVFTIVFVGGGAALMRALRAGQPDERALWLTTLASATPLHRDDALGDLGARLERARPLEVSMLVELLLLRGDVHRAAEVLIDHRELERGASLAESCGDLGLAARAWYESGELEQAARAIAALGDSASASTDVEARFFARVFLVTHDFRRAAMWLRRSVALRGAPTNKPSAIYVVCRANESRDADDLRVADAIEANDWESDSFAALRRRAVVVATTPGWEDLGEGRTDSTRSTQPSLLWPEEALFDARGLFASIHPALDTKIVRDFDRKASTPLTRRRVIMAAYRLALFETGSGELSKSREWISFLSEIARINPDSPADSSWESSEASRALEQSMKLLATLDELEHRSTPAPDVARSPSLATRRDPIKGLLREPSTLPQGFEGLGWSVAGTHDGTTLASLLEHRRGATLRAPTSFLRASLELDSAGREDLLRWLRRGTIPPQPELGVCEHLAATADRAFLARALGDEELAERNQAIARRFRAVVLDPDIAYALPLLDDATDRSWICIGVG